jgi:hypothetical protein
MEFEKAKDRLKGLPNLKNNEEKLNLAAQKLTKLTDKDLNVAAQFVDKTEKKMARDLLKKYIDDYTIETISDKNTLKQLIYFEIIQIRVQNQVNDAKKNDNAVPLKYIDTLHKNSNQIIALKNTLGITHSTGGKEDTYSSLKTLMKKFAVWRKENVTDRAMVCGHCGKVNMLKLRANMYDPVKHPFFQGRFITNKVLLRLYKEGRMSKEEYAEALGVSTDYVDFFIEKIEKKLDARENNE